MLPQDQTKSAVRSRVRTTLEAVSREHWAEASRRVCELVATLPRFRQARTIFAYVPIAHEIDTTPLLRLALEQGKALCLPRIDWQTKTMAPARVTGLDDTQLETTRHAIRQPTASCPIVPLAKLDLILVPAMAFAPAAGKDRPAAERRATQGKEPESGFIRLGRGAGFYDRFFAALEAQIPGAAGRRSLGIALSEQVLPTLPSDPWDVTTPAVATPEGVRGTV